MFSRYFSLLGAFPTDSAQVREGEMFIFMIFSLHTPWHEIAKLRRKLSQEERVATRHNFARRDDAVVAVRGEEKGGRRSGAVDYRYGFWGGRVGHMAE